MLKSGVRFSFREPEVPEPSLRKSPQKQPKRAIFAKIDFWGLKYPPEVLVEFKTCSTICVTHVHTILNQKKLTRSTMGVREGQNMAQNYPNIAPYCSVFWPSLTPTANPVKSLWFKMVCTCVPHIALHVLSSTSTSGGYFRPWKSILAKNAIFGCFVGLFTPPLGCHYGDIETCNA